MYHDKTYFVKRILLKFIYILKFYRNKYNQIFFVNHIMLSVQAPPV